MLAYVPFLFGFAIAFSILLKVSLLHRDAALQNDEKVVFDERRKKTIVTGMTEVNTDLSLKSQLIKRRDQGHLYPNLEVPGLTCLGQGSNPGRVGSEHSRKVPSRQLIRRLFGTPTWPEAGATAGPLHGSPSACGIC